MEKLVNQVLQLVQGAGKKGISVSEIIRKTNNASRVVKLALSGLETEGKIVEFKTRYVTTKTAGDTTCEIVKLAETFGFAKELDSDAEYFIPGRFLLGSIPGDRVLIRTIGSDGRSPTGQVVKIIEYNENPFRALCVQGYFGLVLKPSPSKFSIEIPVAKSDYSRVRDGDRVLARIAKRAKRHSELRAEIIKVYGSDESIEVLCEGVLDEVGVPVVFSDAVMQEAQNAQKKGIVEADHYGRTDLRDKIIFTIDGEDTKDIDDAISIEKTGSGYELGVHIADVSHYVRRGTELDKEALLRGTSIYYADKVIPMLPKALSNGICSLNPNEDRLAFSVLMKMDQTGAMKEYRFFKSIIRSRVKGVYCEINSILEDKAEPAIVEKYSEVSGSFPVMHELYTILHQNRMKRGSPDIDSPESKLIVDGEGRVSEIKLRTRGESERIIEEFMLSANEAAANFGRTKNLPFVYRIHEEPQGEKIEILAEVLKELGISSKGIRPGLPPSALSQAIELSKGTKFSTAVNYQVLRSMAKASYSPEPKGHYGLVLGDYAHFTSPIRRYPDLMIHRIMSRYFEEGHHKTKGEFEKAVLPISASNSASELKSMDIERRCEDIYKADYMRGKLGEQHIGTISSITPHGIYVMLPDTVEGMIKIQNDSLKGLKFIVRYRDPKTGKQYMVGDEVKVTVVRVEVPAGLIDFELAE